MSESVLAMQHHSLGGSGGEAAAQHLAQRASLDLSSRADSGESALSQGSGSAPSDNGQLHTSGSTELDGSSGSQQPEGAAGGSTAGHPPKKVDARSSALKALAGVSAIVSKSRKVDAEALYTIKLQRAKTRAEGHPPGASTLAAAGSASAQLAAGRATPPPPCCDSTGISPFASATSQGLARTPSTSNLAPLHGSTTLGHTTSLPINMQPCGLARHSSTGTPPSDYDALVSQMTLTELVALKQAVEGQLARQALALVQLQAASGGGGGAAAQQAQQADVLSQQYATLLLQSAQQVQLVQQLNAQQQVVAAATMQQALAAAAASAGLSSQPFSPEQLSMAGGVAPPPSAATGLRQYGSPPLPTDPSVSPFACVPFPADAGFGLGDGGCHTSMGLPQQQQHSGGLSKCNGSLHNASTEQHLIGEALHSFLDPERQGPPSRQGSALVNGINWSDHCTSGALLPGLVPTAAVTAPGALPPTFSRSRSLPQHEALYQDRTPTIHAYLGDGGEQQQLPALFSGMHIDTLPGEHEGGSGAPLSCGGSLQLSLPPMVQAAQYSPPHVAYGGDAMHLHPFQHAR